MKKILVTTSTLPSTAADPVPAFVKDQAIWFKKLYPDLDITLLAPHNAYSATRKKTLHKAYTEYRFHYFIPRWELVTGRGIAPALRKNKLLYFELPFLIIAELIATYRYTKKLKPDLLYAHWFTPQAITAAVVSKMTGVPFVFTTHSSDVVVLKKIPLSKKIVAAVCARARVYTAVSAQTTAKLLMFSTQKNRKAIEQKLHAIPMGITFIQPSENDIKSVKGKYGLNDKKVILFIGRLVSIKGINYLLDALAEVRQTISDVCLVIAGDGQEKDKLMGQVIQLGLQDQVVFTGYVGGAEKEGLLGATDILCIPSVKEGDHSEGLHIVFMEGVALGKIVAASDVSGTQEYIKDCENGFIFPQRDSGTLAQTLIRALSLSEPETALLQRNAHALAKDFEWETVAQRHYQLFDSILRTKG